MVIVLSPGEPMEDQVLMMLRDQVGTIMLGTVFLFVGLVASGISAIRGAGKIASSYGLAC